MISGTHRPFHLVRNRGRLLDVFLVLSALTAVSFATFRNLAYRDRSRERSAVRMVAEAEERLLGKPLAPILARSFEHPNGLRELTADAGAIVLLFQSNCPHCDATRSIWAELITSLPPSAGVLAITAESLETGQLWVDGLNSEKTRGYTVESPPWGIPAVPATLLVDSEGRVGWARIGRLTASDLEQLREIYLPQNDEMPTSEEEKK